MRSMVVTLILALCFTGTIQRPSASPTPESPPTKQTIQDESNPSSPAQQKKHAKPAPVELNHTAPANPPAEEKTAPATQTSKPPLDRWFLVYVIFTAALGLMGLSGLGLVYRQLREMTEARKQTDSLIKRAIEQSSALTDSAEQTDRLIQQAIQQSNTAAEQARTANMAACAAKTSAESFGQIAGTSAQSLQFAQETMRLEQRAWVFVTETRVSDLHAGKPLGIVVGFKNTGRTPAKNVQIANCIEVLPKGQVPEPNLEKTQSRGIIPPNGTLFVTIGAGRKNAEGVTDRGLRGIMSGELVVWVYGTTTYEDVFENRQATMFCYMLQPDGKTFGAADMYNDAT